MLGIVFCIQICIFHQAFLQTSFKTPFQDIVVQS